MVKLVGFPTQPAALVGITCMVEVKTLELAFCITKAGRLSLPAAAKPMAGVVFVQL